jgi:hypothetical protein
LVAYHFKLKSENPFARTWGFDYQIRNMTDMQVNLTDATTNQTKTTIPAKFVEYTHSDNTYQQLGKAPDLTHMLFVLYNDLETGEVTGYDIEFKTAKYNAVNFSVPGMFMQQFFLAGELKKIINSFAIVKASTGTTTELTTSTEGSTSGDEGSENAATATSTTTQEEEEDGGDTECDSSYPDDCIPPPPPDLDCGDGGVPENFQVVGSGPHGFDGDNDGIGCESGNNQPDAGEEEEDDGGDGGDEEGGGGGGGADDDGGDGGDEGEGGGEGNDPNEFEGCIVPPGRDPSDAGC